MQRNQPAVWDAVWHDPGLVKDDHLILASEAATTRWSNIRRTLEQRFGSIRGLRVLEIGAGTGTYAALLAQQGAEATVLDYSPAALERSREFFAHNQLVATRIQGDALRLKDWIGTRRFDVALSVGLTEHFAGKKRLAIHQAHLDALKAGGVAVVIVPNAYNPPYRVYKWVSERLGTWKFGEEYPFTRPELRHIAAAIGGRVVALFGDDCYTSLRFLLPANFLRRWLGVGLPKSEAGIRVERGTPVDDWLGYSLIMIFEKA